MKTIDITPTWSDMMPYLVRLIESKGQAQKSGIEELYRMARCADNWNEHVKTEEAKDAKLQESLYKLLDIEVHE